jgi:GNAT superfamily N-acetyltransferase
MDIRPAQVSDGLAACELLCRSIVNGCAADHCNDQATIERWLKNKTPAIVESWFAWPAYFPLVAVADDAIVGVAMLSRPGRIALLHVDPLARLSGVGAALLQALEQHAAALGVSFMRVASTPSARAFFERNGYAETGVTNVAHGQAVVMSKPLSGRRRVRSAGTRRIFPHGNEAGMARM